jgi:hypothetical protein
MGCVRHAGSCCGSDDTICIDVTACGDVSGTTVAVTGPDGFSASGTVDENLRFCFTPGAAGSYTATATPVAGRHLMPASATFTYGTASFNVLIELPFEEGYACLCTCGHPMLNTSRTITAWGITKSMGPGTIYIESGAYTSSWVACFDVPVDPAARPGCLLPAVSESPYCNTVAGTFTLPVVIGFRPTMNGADCSLWIATPALFMGGAPVAVRRDMDCSDYPWTASHPCGSAGMDTYDYYALTIDCTGERYHATVGIGGGADNPNRPSPFCLLPYTDILIEGP